ncbi:hypothetical protein Nepgr_017309 [Nepenthes gracilis]|uniref:Ion transport domain-containing protein n=1 Tax=Nepenthes gracilis TaxID=150966 RepID=A0AAD3SP73_NEPGR|nr:hypothetical protein Nepgr_017309 [Nepenthes gracilis]
MLSADRVSDQCRSLLHLKERCPRAADFWLQIPAVAVVSLGKDKDLVVEIDPSLMNNDAASWGLLVRNFIFHFLRANSIIDHLPIFCEDASSGDEHTGATGSLGGDDEAPQPKESTLAQASLSVISSVLPTPEKDMLNSGGRNPCSCGKNRQWLLYSLRCPAPSPRFIPSQFNCSAGPSKCWDGQELEVDEESELMPNDSDFQRSWFRGIVLELLWKQMKIQYDEKEDQDGSCREQTCRSTSAAAFYVVEADVRSSHEACAEYQIVIWFIIPATRNPQTDHNNNALALIDLLQYVPRLYQIFPLKSQIVQATRVITKTAWAGAAYNLLSYMLTGHVLGAVWYLLSIERYTRCWKSICREEHGTPKCSPNYLDCDSFDSLDRIAWANSTSVFYRCDPEENITFQHGIFKNAVVKNILSSNFIKKYFYCWRWGVQQLSSYGQILQTSTFIGEALFSILIAIVGLVLVAHLIGNKLTYLQSLTVRLEAGWLKRRDTGEWMKHCSSRFETNYSVFCCLLDG